MVLLKSQWFTHIARVDKCPQSWILIIHSVNQRSQWPSVDTVTGTLFPLATPVRWPVSFLVWVYAKCMMILLNLLRCNSWFSTFLHIDTLFVGLYQTHSLVFNYGDGSSRGNACIFAQWRCGFPLFSWRNASSCSGGWCWVFSPGKRKHVFYVCLRLKDMYTFFF